MRKLIVLMKQQESPGGGDPGLVDLTSLKLKIKITIIVFTMISKASIRLMNIFIKYKVK
jgi:hypothetical protein